MVSYHLPGCLFFILLLSTYIQENYAQAEDTVLPEVTIPQGNLQGIIRTTRNGRNVSAFLGIPYAEPPIGDLRFSRPVAAGNWTGTLMANANSEWCTQYMGNAVRGQEDCLYLNVFTPQLPDTTNPSLPVMVYIHGGAFKVLSSGGYGPDYLLDEDVLLVSMNFRLGPIGFLSTGDEVSPGNWGLKDQVMALEWVRDNIEYFGGDPNRVTLFGESGGSICVHLLSLSDATVGLFHRFITQSGSALATWGHRPRAAYSKLAFELGTYVGCSNDTSEALISCLRTVDASDIVSTEPEFYVWDTFPDIIWGPTDEPDVEGAILTDSPLNLMVAGKIADVPWMAGVNRDEGLLIAGDFHLDEALFKEFLNNTDFLLPYMLGWTYLSDSGAAWIEATKSYYFNNDLTTNTSLLLSNFTVLVSDCHFFYPAHKAIKLHNAQAQNPQYLYTLNYQGTFSQTNLYANSAGESYGVSHGDDLIYLFPTASSNPNLTMNEADWEMVDTFIQLWTSFAANGVPTTTTLNGTVTWEPYSTNDNYLRIGDGAETTTEVVNPFYEERMQFWESIDSLVNDSSTVTLSRNLVLLLPIAWAKFLMAAAAAV